MNKKRVIILAVSLVVLGAVFALLAFLSGDGESDDTTEWEDGSKSVSFMNFESDVVSYSVDNGLGSFTLEKSDGRWSVSDVENVELNQNYVTVTVAKACFLYADSLVEENSSNLSAYGLDTPTAVVTLKSADGKQQSIEFGIKTVTSAGYYAVLKGSCDVYIVDTESAERLFGNINTFRNRTLYNINADDVISFSLISDKYNINIAKRTKDSPNQSNLSSWVMQTPYNKSLNGNIFEQNVLQALDFTVVDFVEDNPLDYSKYGLNPPKYTVSVATENTSFTLYLGFESSGNVYARVKDTPNVYTVSSDSVKYKDFTPVYLLESLVFARNLSAVDSVEFVSDTTYFFSKKDGNFTLNGKTVDESDFRKFFETLISPIIFGEADKEKIGNKICSFTFNYNTNTPSETVVYYEYGDMYAAAEVNGKIDFYVKRNFADNMLKSAKNILH